MVSTELVNKVKQYYIENNFGRTLIWIIKKSINRIITSIVNLRKFYIVERPLSGNLPYIKAKIDAIFKLGNLNDMDSFRMVLKPWNRYYKIFKERFERGQTCIVCIHNMQVIGYIWISYIAETDKNLGLTIRPDKKESYGFDLYVLPEYRKFLVGYELISYWLKHSKEVGKLRAIGVVEAKNSPMLITTKLAFGFKTTKLFRSLEFLNKRGVIFQEKPLQEGK